MAGTDAVGDRTVFVTVGTTSFDSLITAMSCPETLEVLQARGYTKIIYQLGRGSIRPPERSPVAGIDLTWYDFKPSLSSDIANAALVIGHAGAGTVIETLESRRPMVVVVNDTLMHNHQVELAQQMQEDQHLVHCTCSTLADTLRSLQPANFKPYRHADPTLFGRYMDAVLAPEKSSVAYLASVVQLALAAAVLAYYLGAVPWLIGWV